MQCPPAGFSRSGTDCAGCQLERRPVPERGCAGSSEFLAAGQVPGQMERWRAPAGSTEPEEHAGSCRTATANRRVPRRSRRRPPGAGGDRSSVAACSRRIRNRRMRSARMAVSWPVARTTPVEVEKFPDQFAVCDAGRGVDNAECPAQWHPSSRMQPTCILKENTATEAASCPLASLQFANYCQMQTRCRAQPAPLPDSVRGRSGGLRMRSARSSATRRAMQRGIDARNRCFAADLRLPEGPAQCRCSGRPAAR